MELSEQRGLGIADTLGETVFQGFRRFIDPRVEAVFQGDHRSGESRQLLVEATFQGFRRFIDPLAEATFHCL